MNKGFKLFILSLVFVSSFSLVNKVYGADCGACKFDSGACTIDLRPGEGDGTLCGCKDAQACTKGTDNACGCKAIGTEGVVKNVTTNAATTPSVNSTNNPTTSTKTSNNTVKTSSDGSSSSFISNPVNLVLIGVGLLVLAGGIFGIVKFSKAKK